MKVLVAYFSQSGNTEKIAKAIWEEASQGNETDLKKLEDITPGDVAQYDFIFIGSPMYAGVQKKLDMSDAQWADMVRQMTGHPDEKDVANAKTCAKAVLG